MSDDFIRGLQRDWQAQDDRASNVLRRIRSRRWIPHLVLGGEIASGVCAIVAGIWFAWTAVYAQQHKLLFALSAFVMLVTVPIMCLLGFRIRYQGLAWDDKTPEALLRTGIQRAETSLKAMRLGYWNIWIIVAFIATLWTAAALGFIHAQQFLILYSALSLGISLIAWLWMAHLTKRLRRDREAYARLLTMLNVVENG